MVIQRQNLRGQVRLELLERMHAGQLRPGEGVNEVQLATELGVSRTPLREALIALENEGLISSEQGRGFRFTPVSAEEFSDLCPVLAALEVLALESSPLEHLVSVAPELARRAREFSSEVAEHGVINRHDDEWHDILLSGCTNSRLMDLLTTLKLALRRYEMVMVPEEAMIRRASLEHAAIAERIAARDVPGAVAALRANWLNGMARVLASFPAEGLDGT